MLLVYVFIICFAVASATSTVGVRGKTYPGFTYWSNNKTGEVIKIIGPIYEKIKRFEVTKPPLDLKSIFSVHIEFTPTIEFRSIFVDGVLFVNGFIFRKSDPAKDLCMEGSKELQCPLRPGKNYIFKKSWNFSQLGFPVLSARYVCKATVKTVDEITGEDVTVAGVEINIDLS